MQMRAAAAPGEADVIAALLRDGSYKSALNALLALHHAAPFSVQTVDDMATCYWNLGDHETALKLVERVAEESPHNERAFGKLGAMALSVGDVSRARDAFASALQINPNAVSALAAAHRIDPFARDSHGARKLRRLAQQKSLDPAERATAYNVLARMDEATGHLKQAFVNFGRAKALSPGRYDRKEVDQFVDQQIAMMSETPHPVAATPDQPTFVFIVGLPRSGTTLVESILSQHSSVGTLGETGLLAETVALCRHRTGTAGDASGPWDWYSVITDDDLAHLRKTWLSRCAERFATDFPAVILEKAPLNLFELGFARRLLPDARFIFLSRHPLDAGLSNFTTNYFAAHRFSKNLDSIGHMTRAICRSAAHYRAVLGPSFRHQSFRALVTQPETQIRALVAHMGLGWEPACLAPEQRKGRVDTASVAQVRSAINADGLGKWERYADFLDPLAAALGGWDWIRAWEAEDEAAQG